MGITGTTYKSILKEYEELQQSHARERDERIAEIDRQIPEYSQIEARITSLYIKRSMLRLKAEDGLSDSDIREQITSLNQKKESLLREAGYTPAYLEMEYTCPHCKDTGYLDDGSICSCFKAKLTERLYDISHIRGILDKENFNTFNFKYYDDGKSLDIAREAVAKARNFVSEFDSSSSNLFLTGGTGVGKTFLSNCIAKELIESGHSVIYLSAVRFFDVLADSAFSRDADSDLSARLLYDTDLLIIDDLGTEMINSFVQTQLFNVINERILRQKHTIISANLSVQDLQTKYSERVFSRVASSYTIIKLFARDIRIQKALED